MADVEDHAPRPGFDHRLAHGAVRGRGVVGKGTEGVGEDVALAHAREHVLEGRRRMVDMNHYRQPELLRRLPRDVERDKAGILRSMPADADFDADDRIQIASGDLDRVDRRHEPEVAALADHHALRKAEYAGERNIEISEDSDRGRTDHMAQEPRKVAWSRAPGVDQRRAASPGEPERIDAQGRAAPIDMGVKINEARRHDVPGHVANVAPGEFFADLGDAAALEADVHDGVDPLRRIEDPPP